MAAYLPLRGRVPVLRGRRSECGALDRLIEAVQAGASRALVVRGEPGVGKTALLDYLAGHASGCRVVRAAGAQPDMESAAQVKHDEGALDAALGLLVAAGAGPPDALRAAEVEHLRGQIAFDQQRGTAAPRLLLGALALRFIQGYAAAVPALTRARVLADFADHASSVLYNGLGRHDAARDAARRAFERDQLGFGPFIAPELAEAASRTGDEALVRAALEWLSERTRVTPTQWALAIQARLRSPRSGRGKNE